MKKKLHIFGDLLGVSVFSEESSENSLSSHPENLGGHSGVFGTLSLTVAGVSASSSGLVETLHSGVGVHVDLSSHDETILEELSDVLSCRDLLEYVMMYLSWQEQLHWFRWGRSRLSFYRTSRLKPPISFAI